MDSWNKISKPVGATWSEVSKPNNTTTTTVTSQLHAKGKFMGILGLTYPGTTTTTVTTTTIDWSKISKPVGANWNSIHKPTN